MALPFTELNEMFKRVEEYSRIENLNKEERRRYERELKYCRDYNNSMLTAKENGYAEGRAEERKQNAMALLKAGIPAETVSKALNLSVEELDKLVSHISK